GGGTRFAASLSQRFASLETHQGCDVFDPLTDQIRHTAQLGSALPCAGAAPFGKTGLGCSKGRIHISFRGNSNGAQLGLGYRIRYAPRLTVRGRAPVARNE